MRAKNDTQAQYCKTPVDNARSDIDRSSSDGTWRNDCSAVARMKISEADAHNDTIETKGRRRKRKRGRFASVCSRTSDIYEKETERALENKSRISQTGSEIDEEKQLAVHPSRNSPQMPVISRIERCFTP